MAQKKERFITPVGTLVWPKLNTPDVYTPKKGPEKVRYVTNFKLSDEDYKKVLTMLKKKAKELMPDVEKPKLPFKKDKKTDEITLVASSGVKYRPPVFDAKNKKIPAGVIIGGGSKARLDLTISHYEISAENSGINLYINGVQVIELVEGGQGKSNFDETEGFSYDGPEDTEEQGFGGGAADPSGDEDFSSL